MPVVPADSQPTLLPPHVQAAELAEDPSVIVQAGTLRHLFSDR
jgi:hypothetical protein